MAWGFVVLAVGVFLIAGFGMKRCRDREQQRIAGTQRIIKELSRHKDIV